MLILGGVMESIRPGFFSVAHMCRISIQAFGRWELPEPGRVPKKKRVESPDAEGLGGQVVVEKTGNL